MDSSQQLLVAAGDFLRVICMLLGFFAIAKLTEAVIYCTRSGWATCKESFFKDMGFIFLISISLLRTSGAFGDSPDPLLVLRFFGLSCVVASLYFSNKNLKQFLFWSKFPDAPEAPARQKRHK